MPNIVAYVLHLRLDALFQHPPAVELQRPTPF
jgi:hypothetical protein